MAQRLDAEHAELERLKESKSLAEAQRIAAEISRRRKQHFSVQRMSRLISAIREENPIIADVDVYREVVRNLEFVDVVEVGAVNLLNFPEYVRPDLPPTTNDPASSLDIFLANKEATEKKLAEYNRIVDEAERKLTRETAPEVYESATGDLIEIRPQPVEEAFYLPIFDPQEVFNLSNYTELHIDPNHQIDPMYLPQ